MRVKGGRLEEEVSDVPEGGERWGGVNLRKWKRPREREGKRETLGERT